MSSKPAAIRHIEFLTISVVIPCLNAEKWISRAIHSVLDQAYPATEIIVIDDGSTDGSLDIIKSLGSKVCWESSPNRGAQAARNRGMELSTSDYILFLDADDYLEGPYLSGLASAARSTRADLVIGRGVNESRGGIRRDRLHHDGVRDPFDLTFRILTKEALQTSQMFWKRSFLVGIGGWNEKVILSMDVELSIRALVSRPSISYSNQGNCVWNNHVDTARISARKGIAAHRSGLDWFDGVKNAILSSGNANAIDALAGLYYSVAADSYAHGWTSLGDKAMRAYRDLGFKFHRGKLSHCVICTLIGLDRKLRLAKQIRKSIQDFRRVRRGVDEISSS